NGVKIEGARSLVSGDVIALGSATLVFHRSLGLPERGPTLGLSQLRQRTVEELERALRHERHLTVMALNARTATPNLNALAQRLSAGLRFLDTVGTGAEQIFVLMPETGQEEAPKVAKRLLEAVRELAPEAS